MELEEDWQGLEATLVDDLTPEVLQEAAERLRSSPGTFVARVTRESELDAMWSLVDLALGAARRADPDTVERTWLPRATVDDLTVLGNLIFEAHDLSAEGRFSEAAALLDGAAAKSRAYTA